MIPIGPLMREHRLIEHMIALMKSEVTMISGDGRTDPVFIETAVDFFRTYADRCHHGKEENILFVQLKGKSLLPHHEAIVSELFEEHRVGRKTVRNLLDANARYKSGSPGALDEIAKLLNFLIDFYPAHIAKEDKSLFFPCMEYFTKRELAVMLDQFWEFDRKLIHEKYSRTIAEFEKVRLTGPQGPPPEFRVV
jgi:hemerythrin-like domain-containing protein